MPHARAYLTFQLRGDGASAVVPSTPTTSDYLLVAVSSQWTTLAASVEHTLTVSDFHEGTLRAAAETLLSTTSWEIDAAAPRPPSRRNNGGWDAPTGQQDHPYAWTLKPRQGSDVPHPDITLRGFGECAQPGSDGQCLCNNGPIDLLFIPAIMVQNEP